MPYDPLQLQTDVDFITSQPQWQDEKTRRDYIRQVGVQAKGSLDNEAHTELMNTLWGKMDTRGKLQKAGEFAGRAVGEVVKSIPATFGAVGTALGDIAGITDTGSEARLKAGVSGLVDTAGQRIKQLDPNDRQEQRDVLIESLREDIDKGAVPRGFEKWLAGGYDNKEIDDPETRAFVDAVVSGISRASVAADHMGDIDAYKLRSFMESDRSPFRSDSDLSGEMGARQFLADYVATRDPQSWQQFKDRVTETDAQYRNRLRVYVAQKPRTEEVLASMPEGLEKEMVQRSLSMQESPIDLASALVPAVRGAKALQAAKAGGFGAAAGRFAKGAGIEGAQEAGTEALQDPRATAAQIAEAGALGAVGAGALEAGAAGIGAASRRIGGAPAAAPTTPETPAPVTPSAAESVTVESGESPLPAVLKTLDEKVKAAVDANADVLPATAAALKETAPEPVVEEKVVAEAPAAPAAPVVEEAVVTETPAQEESPAAPPAEPTDATEGQTPTPGGVGAPPVVTNEPQTPSPAEQPVSAAETPVATEPEAPLPETEKVVAPKAEPDQGAGMTQRDTSKPERIVSERKAEATKKVFESIQKALSSGNEFQIPGNPPLRITSKNKDQFSLNNRGELVFTRGRKGGVISIDDVAAIGAQVGTPFDLLSLYENLPEQETIKESDALAVAQSDGGIAFERLKESLGDVNKAVQEIETSTGMDMFSVWPVVIDAVADSTAISKGSWVDTEAKAARLRSLYKEASEMPESKERADAIEQILMASNINQSNRDSIKRKRILRPEAPPTQTETQPKPEDASKNQVEETGGTPPVESQPPQTRPEGEAQEGASQRGREGEEGVLTPEKAAPGVEPGAAAETPLPQTQQTPIARPSGEPFAAPTAESRAAAPGQIATARSVIDEERKRLGRPPVEGPIMEAISDEAIYAQAKAEYDKDPKVGDRLVDSLNARPRAVDSLQQAILGQELVRRRNALDIASDAYIADPKNTQLEDAFNEASAKYEEAKFAAQYGISDVGRTLRLARVLLNLDFSKAGLITRFRQASGGVDPNAEQLKKIDELSKTILESEKKVEELRATKEENARLQELLDNMVQDMKDQAIREFNSVEKARKEAKAAFKAAPNKVSALDTLEEKIRARRAERKKKVMADPFLLNALADAIDDVMLGAIKIAKGVRNVAKWMSEMKAENPDYTDEQLQEIRKASETFYENEIKPELGAEAPAAEVVEEETLEDEEGEEGKVFVTFDDVTGRDIYRMVKDRVQKGMTEIGEVMKSVTEEIQQQLPDVTERQVRDRFSGYGRPLFPSQEASAKKVRELRTLAQYASKIEDAQKKIAPLRSGKQRDDATEAIRQAQKELYRLMKENGLEMPPSPRSLKGPLDVIKRRLKNRRDDLQRQMAAGKRDVVSTKKVERDAEAKALEEEIRALDEALDALDPPLPPSYQDKVKDRMRAVDKEIVELRRKIKERDVSKQKPEPIITEQLQVKLNERDALKQALDDLRIEIEGEPQLTQEEINERAERVLDRNIDALEAEIERLKDPNYFPQEAQKAEATPTIIRLRKQQEILREERKKLSEARFGKKVKSESERADIAIAALEKSIDNINQKILTGDLSPTARKGTPLENAKIKNLRAERNSLRSVMNLMRKAKADAAKDPVAEQIRRDRKYLQSRIEYYENIQKKMADGTYKPKVKEQRKYDESLGKELQKLEDAKMAVADMLLQERLKNRSTLRKAFDFIGDLFGIQRVLTATADISAIGNQGNFILFSNPKIAFKAIPDMLRAMKNPEGEKAVQERIRNMQEYKDGELNRVGLYLSMDAGPNSPLSKMEEQYATRLVNKWPKAFGGGIVRGSERAYKTFLDVIRVAAYKSMKETLVKGGWFTPPQEATQERLEDLANLVNNATGRGSFKMKKADQLLSQAAPFLNTFIFAPRFGLSRFAMALGLPLWRASPGTRALIAQEYAKYAIGVTVATLLLSLAQDDEDEPIVPDPRATDFLKTRFGDYRVDLLGGFQQPFVFLTRLLTGETVTSKGKVRALREGDRPLDLLRERPLKLKPNYGSADASSVLGDFLRFKLAPTSASILNALSGKDPVGNRTDVKSEILKAPVPLVVGQLVESLSADDPADAALLSTLGLTGIRTSYQGKDADKNKTEWEKMVKKVEELTGIK